MKQIIISIVYFGVKKERMQFLHSLGPRNLHTDVYILNKAKD